MSRGQDLWEEAKHLIPGGNQLLSKRAERFLPGFWPAYYTKAKGCKVWDLDDNEYYDFAQMGVGSCVLGYADDDVNDAVLRAVQDGNMSTLNCFEEIELAKRLTEIHPWADAARFARTGGEACAVAIRIARASAGKGRVAFCGYHGWHDWYLAANLGNSSNLDGQLLPGLQPAGVPRGLKDSALPFSYNQADELEALFSTHDDIGVVIMEPQRGHAPEPGFLERVRELASENGAVLIFDEVTSGFRMNFGGIHMLYGVNPDIAVFGKALGNGYPIAAIIGTGAVMDAAQDSFISSTMWTERTGYAAALATLNKMESESVPEKLISLGEYLNAGWEKLAAKHGVEITIDGIPPLTHISFQHDDAMALQTLYTQEMLKKGYLVGAAVYMTAAYTTDIIDAFLHDSDDVFAQMRTAIDSGDIRPFLDGDVIMAGFKRLT